ncbi:MAG: helix-turn-helix domain-containing protein [Desulfobacteraceae bacterium]|nr:helix-turn-helix domain-containing protein [Desulfobacteraceae bacterium]
MLVRAGKVLHLVIAIARSLTRSTLMAHDDCKLANRMLSPNDLAAKLNISRRTIQTWRASDNLPPPDLHIGKVIRWKVEPVDVWLIHRWSYLTSGEMPQPSVRRDSVYRWRRWRCVSNV